jgi:hypothetical protein
MPVKIDADDADYTDYRGFFIIYILVGNFA